jgi:ketosteroid isomerase-like protein
MRAREHKRTREENQEGDLTMTTLQEQDRETIIAIVKEMADSMTGAQSTRHWAADALWFDIPAFASKGVQPALEMFDKVFSTFTSCTVEILSMDTMLNGNMGIVCTVQRTTIVFKNGDTRQVMSRQTDCFEKRGNDWQLIHQHASVPAGGDWDGTIITA